MPLDTSIPLQVGQTPQVQAINPMSLYQMMQERQAGALRNQLVQQEMLKNAMIMQNTEEDRRLAAATRAEAARKAQEDKANAAYLINAIRGGYTPAKNVVMGPGTVQGSTPASFDEGRVLNALYAKGNPALLTAYSNMQEQFGKQREAEAKATGQSLINKGLDIKNTTDQLAQLNAGLERASTPEEIDALFDGSADAIRMTGKTPDMSKAAFRQLASQIGFDAAKQQVAQGVTAVQKHLSDMMTAQKPELKNISGTGMVAINPYTGEGKRVTIDGAPLSTTASEIPELKKGEIWNPKEQRVEAVPGSDIYTQQSARHGKDYGALNDLNTTTDMTTKTIDKILDPKNQTGFERNFGGYNAALMTQYSPDAQDVKADIETLKSQLKTAGLKLIRQGGSIGSMTEKEWPIVQNMIDTLTPYMSEEKARDTLNEIKARVAAIRDTAKDTYETTWGNSQYYKPTVGKKSEKETSSTSTPSGATVSNW